MSTPQIDTIRRYLACLHATDVPGLVATFEPDGIVRSPFLGTLQADAFSRAWRRLRRAA